jgi:choline-glycine betaine transporter
MGLRDIFFHWSLHIPDTYVVVGPVLSEMHVSFGHTLQSVISFLLRTVLFVACIQPCDHCKRT